MARGFRDTVDQFDIDGARAADKGAERADGPSPVDLHVGARIKLRRCLLGYSQEKLGDALGLTFQQVQKYERGANRVSASRLYDLGRVLDVPVSFFFDDYGSGGSKVAASAFGFAEGQEAFGLSPDLLSRRETIDLVGAYWRITDLAQRRRVLDLIKGMNPAGA
jgi:transcriptional regulator with XRE-family HTH domain